MSFGGFGGTIEAPEVAAVFDSIPALQAPDIDVSPSPGFVEEIEAALGRGVSPELGPSPQDIQDIQDIQLQQQVFDDLTLPQEAIQTGLGILAEDANPFVPSGLLPLDESGQRQLAAPLQITDKLAQFLTPANVLGLLSPGLGAATRIGGPLLRDIFSTQYTPSKEDLELTTDLLTGQPVGLPDLDELRRQQIGLPVEEEDTTTDESPFFQPVTDVAFLDPREPNLLNQTPANLQAFLTARNLPNVDFQALNTAFAQRPPFGLPIASNTRTPSLLS